MLMLLLLWLWWVSKFLRSGTSETIGCSCRNLGTSKTGQLWSFGPCSIWPGPLQLTHPDPLPVESKRSNPFLIYWTMNHTEGERVWEKKKNNNNNKNRRQRDFFFFFFGMAFNIVYLLVVLRRVGPIESTKNWVMKFWKYLPNGWGIEIGVFWVMNNEWWMMSDEWRKLSEEW